MSRCPTFISNSTPNGGSVKIGSTNLSISKIKIWVKDTGCGMSEEEKEQIFNFGYGKRGGFGLWWSRNYLLRLDGMIEVESTEGEGSIFRIILPKAAQEGNYG